MPIVIIAIAASIIFQLHCKDIQNASNKSANRTQVILVFAVENIFYNDI